MECVDMTNSGWLVSGLLNSLLFVWMKTYRSSDSCSRYTPDVFDPIILTANNATSSAHFIRRMWHAGEKRKTKKNCFAFGKLKAG